MTPMTPRDLIIVIAQWDLDKPFETIVRTLGQGHPEVILTQDDESINLTKGEQ